MQAEEKKSSGTASNQSNPADKDLYTTRDGVDKWLRCLTVSLNWFLLETRGKLDLEIRINDISFFITGFGVFVHPLYDARAWNSWIERNSCLSHLGAAMARECDMGYSMHRPYLPEAAHDLCLPIPIALHRIQNFSCEMFSGIYDHFSKKFRHGLKLQWPAVRRETTNDPTSSSSLTWLAAC